MKLRQQGFTLIEIAIVLVIIGLLLGGVLKGQELITSAKVRSLNNRVDGIAAAWFGFQDRYRALPGDYNQASVNIDATLTNGGANGQINTNAERGDVWDHLSSAGFISGSYDSGNVAANAYNCATTRCPDNGFARGMNITFANLGQTNGSNANELLTGSSIPVEVLAELDRKIDDGNPSTGTMQLGANGGGWAGSAACINAGGGPGGVDVYQLVTNPSQDCAAVFRNL